MITQGDALDLISSFEEKPFLIATDPPYAFGADAKEHALSATVAVVLREAAKRLQRGGLDAHDERLKLEVDGLHGRVGQRDRGACSCSHLDKA